MSTIDPRHLLDLISRSYPGLIAYFDLELRYLFGSHTYEEWFGINSRDIVGLRMSDLIGVEGAKARQSHVEKVLRGETVIFEATFEIKNLGTRIVEQKYFPDLRSDGKVQGFVVIAYDVTDKKNAELAAEHERQRLYSLFMQAPINLTVLTGPEYIFEICNPLALEYMHGKDITGLTLREALSEQQVAVFKPLLDEVYHTKKSIHARAVEVQIPQPDGSFRQTFFDLYYEPWLNEKNEVQGILNLGVDVTEQMLEKKKVLETEMLFRTYAESMPQMAFIADPKGNILYFNKRWYDYIGLDEELSKKWKDQPIHHPEDLQRTIDRWSESIRTGKLYEIEYRLRSKTGSYRWFLGRAIPLRDGQGNITQWVGTNTDIQEQKEIENNQARLVQLMNSSTDFIGFADLSGKVFFLNKAARLMTGIDLDEDAGNFQIMDFFFDEDHEFVKQVIIPATLHEGSWTGEFRFKDQKAGEEKWVHYNSFTTKDELTGEPTAFATVSRDLSDIKANERKLELALKARDEFLSIASHELKTPLTSLKLQSQMVLRGIKAHDPIQTDRLVSRLSHLIDDMLDVSRIKNGKLRLNKDPVNLVELVKEVLGRMDSQFPGAPKLESPEELVGHWDRFRIEQVLGNLLTNTIKYGLGKPVEIIIRPGLSGKALIGVRDQGLGISKADIERIFGKFERAINSSEVSGMGLGLFITKEIVESHGGIIWVESELNTGSTFWVELPLMLDSE
jgi:PAS domain S-box-containing protein